MKFFQRAFAALLLALTLTFQAGAQNVQQLGPNYFAAGVPSDEFSFYAVAEIGGRQRCPEWCWAACSQMVLNYHGLYITQEEIVNKVFGTLNCKPGTPHDILLGLSGWAPDTRGRYSGVQSVEGINSANEIVQNLAYKWPIIVGLNNLKGGGHAYVLTAIYYSVDQNNNAIPDKVALRDPWPTNPSRQEMSWQEFSSRFLTGIKVWVVRY